MRRHGSARLLMFNRGKKSSVSVHKYSFLSIQSQSSEMVFHALYSGYDFVFPPTLTKTSALSASLLNHFQLQYCHIDMLENMASLSHSAKYPIQFFFPKNKKRNPQTPTLSRRSPTRVSFPVFVFFNCSPQFCYRLHISHRCVPSNCPLTLAYSPPRTYAAKILLP